MQWAGCASADPVLSAAPRLPMCSCAALLIQRIGQHGTAWDPDRNRPFALGCRSMLSCSSPPLPTAFPSVYLCYAIRRSPGAHAVCVAHSTPSHRSIHSPILPVDIPGLLGHRRAHLCAYPLPLPSLRVSPPEPFQRPCTVQARALATTHWPLVEPIALTACHPSTSGAPFLPSLLPSFPTCLRAFVLEPCHAMPCQCTLHVAGQGQGQPSL